LGGNGSSVGGGSEAEEESIDGSSGCWEPESPTKDCVHLDNLGQTDLQATKHLHHHPHDQLQIQNGPDQHSSLKCDNGCNHPSNSSIQEDNSVLQYNFHQNPSHNNPHQQHSLMPYGFQSDIIMSMS
jgi:hypothetical protein